MVLVLYGRMAIMACYPVSNIKCPLHNRNLNTNRLRVCYKKKKKQDSGESILKHMLKDESIE